MSSENSRKRTLTGTSTQATEALSVNTGYMQQELEELKLCSGSGFAGVHYTLGIGCYYDRSSINHMAELIFMTLQRNSNRTASYDVNNLVQYLMFVQKMWCLLDELKKDMATFRMSDAFVKSMPMDYWGYSYRECYQDWSENKSTIISEINTTADRVRNALPFPSWSGIELGRYLLGNIFRDDEKARAQYVYFHSAAFQPKFPDYTKDDTYVDPAAAINISDFGKAEKLSVRAAALHAKYDAFVTSNKWIAQLAADIVRVYGITAYTQWTPVTDADMITFINDPELFGYMQVNSAATISPYEVGEYDVQPIGGAWSQGHHQPTLLNYEDDYSLGTGYAVGFGGPATEEAAREESGYNWLYNVANRDTVAAVSRNVDFPENAVALTLFMPKHKLTWKFSTAATKLPTMTITEETAAGFPIQRKFVNYSWGEVGAFPVELSGVVRIEKQYINQNVIELNGITLTTKQMDAIGRLASTWVGLDTYSLDLNDNATPYVYKQVNPIAEVDEWTTIEPTLLSRMMRTCATAYTDANVLFLNRAPGKAGK